MLVLDILKASDSNIIVPHGVVVHANSRYAISVTAPEFASHLGETSVLSILKDGAAVASCNLYVDPLRRNKRTGELSLGDIGGTAKMYVTLGDSVLFSQVLKVEGTADDGESGGSGGGGSTPSSRWTVVDLGTITSTSITVADMTQVSLSASRTSMPLRITTADGFFEAYVSIVGLSEAFPFGDVLVDGRPPAWDYKDSLALEKDAWTLHLMKVSGVIRAELRAEAAPGVEADPDNDLVTSVNVNE